MYCRHCGKEIADTAMFCRFCGTPITKIAQAAPAGTAAPGTAPAAKPAAAPAQPAQAAPGTDSTLIPNQPIDQSAPPLTVEEGLYPWMSGEARTFHEVKTAPKQAAKAQSQQSVKPLDFDPMQHPYLKGVSREEAMVDAPFEPAVNTPVNATGGDQSFTSVEVHHDQPAAPAQPAAPQAPAAPDAGEALAQQDVEEIVIEPAPTLGPITVEETPNPFTAFDELPTMPEPPDPNAGKK